MEIFQRDFSIRTILAAMRDDKDSFDMQRQIISETNYQAKIELLQAPLLEISSTTIRNRAAQKRLIRYIPIWLQIIFKNCNYIPKEKRRS